MPVDIEEPQLTGAGGGVAAGDRHLQLRGLPGGGELAELAADRLDLRGPVQAQHPAQRPDVDPGGALGAGLAEQRLEHPQDQHGVQPVEPVPQSSVHRAGAFQQASAAERGQRQQQARQRVAGAGDEDRDGALAEQPEPGQRPLPVPARRIRQHRQQLPARRPALSSGFLSGGSSGLISGRLPASGGLLPGGALARRGRAGRAQRVADRRLRHPGRGGDLSLGPALPVQLPDPRRHLRSQLRRPPRALPGRDQARHPAAGQRPVPPPHGHRDHPERARHPHLGRGVQLHQLHRGQPPARLVPGVPRERRQPVHPHHAAAIGAVHHAHARRDLLGVPGQQRQRRLSQHPRHYPASARVSNLSSIIADRRCQRTDRHAGKYLKRPGQRPRNTP